MPSKTDGNHKKISNPSEEIEKEFESFFNDCLSSECTKSELNKVLLPLKIRLWKIWLLKLGSVILTFLTVVCLIYYVDFINWHFSAIGRLTLAKVRPIWDWENLYKEKCLVNLMRGAEVDNSRDSKVVEGISLKECAVCENFGNPKF